MPSALDGLAAVAAAEVAASQAVFIQSDDDFARSCESLPDSEFSAGILRLTERGRMAGLAAGLSASGQRCSLLLGESSGLRDALRALAGERLSPVVHLLARRMRRQATAIHGAHEDFHALADTGLLEFFASNVQEAVDFSLIAHRIAELSLTPALCGQDFYETGQSVQEVFLPEAGLIDAYLGRPEDSIEAPTPAQRMLFGEDRRRIPAWIDLDGPAGLGGIQGRESFFAAAAGQRPFFADHASPLLERAMQEFGDLTGRRYGCVQCYRAEDADVLVLAMGALAEKLGAVVDYLRSEEGVRVGLVNPSVWRPFPGAALTRLLAGKKALSIFERTDVPLAGDGPLTRELRAALDKAAENGATEGEAWPEFATYARATERPRLFCANFGLGTSLPSFEALCSAVRNMLPGGAGRRRYYLGIDLQREPHGLPQLVVTAQSCRADYPGLEELSLPETPLRSEPALATAVALHAPPLQGGLDAGKLFARALHDALGLPLRSFAEGGLEPGLHPARFTLVHGSGDLRTCPSRPAILLVSGESLLATLVDTRVQRGAALLVAVDARAEAFWSRLDRRVASWIAEHDMRLYPLDAAKIGADAAARRSFVAQLEIWALFGAVLAVEDYGSEETERIEASLRGLLETKLGDSDPRIEEILSCCRRGRSEASEFDWRSVADVERPPAIERDAPWTLEETAPDSAAVFDSARFWRSVGYLYDSGRAADVLADPFLATALMPARSSAHRDMAPYRLRLPQWRAENCTGCGLCWSLCPDSALPATLQGTGDLIDTAVRACRDEGMAMTQAARITTQLAKQAQRLAARDELRQYCDAGALLGEAFDELMQKMTPDDATREALSADFEKLRDKLVGFPVARTQKFFETADPARARFVSINVNPASCKACGLCVEECPDDAFDWTAQSGETLAVAGRHWAFQMRLPVVPAQLIAETIDEAAIDSEMNRLLDRDVYHSMVGGDGAAPGNGLKTALHLVTAAAESVMRERYLEHAERLSELIDGLRKRIRGEVADVLRVNDFEDFAARLSALGSELISPETLAETIGHGERSGAVDAAELARLSALLTELEAQRRQYAGPKPARARLVLALDHGDVILFSGSYPDNPHASPWISHTGGDGVGLAQGIAEGISARLRRELAARRLAERAVQGKATAEEFERFPALSEPGEARPEERALMPPVLMVCDRRRLDWRAARRVLAAALPIHLLILDRDAIPADDMQMLNPAILALQQADAQVLQGSIGNPGHLLRGTVRCVAAARPSLIQVLAPEPHGNGIAPDSVARQARLAVESRAAPLFHFDPQADGRRPDLRENPLPGQTWSRRELEVPRDSAGKPAPERDLTVADWAIHESRFRQHFRILAAGRVADDMAPLAKYLAMPDGERGGLTPYIDIADEAGRHCIAVVSGEMVRMTERCRDSWRDLREWSRGGTPPPPPAPEPEREAQAPEEASPARPRAEPQAQEALRDRLLELIGFAADEELFSGSLREFVEQRRAQAAPDDTDD